MPTLKNRAGVSSSTAGTGTLTLGAAIAASVSPYLSSWQTFASAGIADGQEVRYLILDNNGAWERGKGIYTAAGTTLTRTFEESSTGSILSLSGTEHVFIAAMGEDILNVLAMNHALCGGL